MCRRRNWNWLQRYCSLRTEASGNHEKRQRRGFPGRDGNEKEAEEPLRLCAIWIRQGRGPAAAVAVPVSGIGKRRWTTAVTEVALLFEKWWLGRRALAVSATPQLCVKGRGRDGHRQQQREHSCAGKEKRLRRSPQQRRWRGAALKSSGGHRQPRRTHCAADGRCGGHQPQRRECSSAEREVCAAAENRSTGAGANLEGKAGRPATAARNSAT